MTVLDIYYVLHKHNIRYKIRSVKLQSYDKVSVFTFYDSVYINKHAPMWSCSSNIMFKKYPEIINNET